MVNLMYNTHTLIMNQIRNYIENVLFPVKSIYQMERLCNKGVFRIIDLKDTIKCFPAETLMFVVAASLPHFHNYLNSLVLSLLTHTFKLKPGIDASSSLSVCCRGGWATVPRGNVRRGGDEELPAAPFIVVVDSSTPVAKEQM